MIYNVSEMFSQSIGFTKKVNIKSNSSFYEGIGKVLVSEAELNLIKTDNGIWVLTMLLRINNRSPLFIYSSSMPRAAL